MKTATKKLPAELDGGVNEVHLAVCISLGEVLHWDTGALIGLRKHLVIQVDKELHVCLCEE